MRSRIPASAFSTNDKNFFVRSPNELSYRHPPVLGVAETGETTFSSPRRPLLLISAVQCFPCTLPRPVRGPGASFGNGVYLLAAQHERSTPCSDRGTNEHRSSRPKTRSPTDRKDHSPTVTFRRRHVRACFSDGSKRTPRVRGFGLPSLFVDTKGRSDPLQGRVLMGVPVPANPSPFVAHLPLPAPNHRCDEVHTGLEGLRKRTSMWTTRSFQGRNASKIERVSFEKH